MGTNQDPALTGGALPPLDVQIEQSWQQLADQAELQQMLEDIGIAGTADTFMPRLPHHRSLDSKTHRTESHKPVLRTDEPEIKPVIGEGSLRRVEPIDLTEYAGMTVEQIEAGEIAKRAMVLLANRSV